MKTRMRTAARFAHLLQSGRSIALHRVRRVSCAAMYGGRCRQWSVRSAGARVAWR